MILQKQAAIVATIAILVTLSLSSSTVTISSIGYCIVTGITLIFIQLLVSQYTQYSNEPPLFAGNIPYLGLGKEFGTDHASLLRKLAIKSGESPAFTAYIAGQRMTFIKNPLHFSAVLKEGKKRLQFRPVAQKIMGSAFNVQEDMESNSYHLWEKQSPHQWKMLRGKPLLHLMAQTQNELIEALNTRETIDPIDNQQEWHQVNDLYEMVVDLMWQATGRSFFGNMFDDDDNDSLGSSSSSSSSNVSTRSIKSMTKAKQSFQTFDENFPLLAGGVPHQFLSDVSASMQYLRSKFSNKNKKDVSKENASDIIAFRQEFLFKHFNGHSQGSFQLGFLWATMANTLPTAFWSLYFVTRDKIALKKCREEADAVLKPWLNKNISSDSKSIGVILSKMPRLESVVNECLRLCIASITLREAMEDFELKLGKQSVNIRKGDHVVLAPTLTHYDEEIYQDPFVFQWDRFLVVEEKEKEKEKKGDEKEDEKEDEKKEEKEASLSGPKKLPVRYKNGKKLPPSIALQPFGGGTTMCPGRHFALAEIKAFVALILVKWDLKYEEDEMFNGSLSMGHNGVPRLEQARAGLGSLPPLKSDKVKCKWRVRK